MAKFNVGDRVVCLFPQCAGNVEFKAGCEGVVTHVDNEHNSISVDNLMGYSGKPVFSPDAFDLVEAAPKKQKRWLKATEARIAELKVGDKVKLRSGLKATITGVYFDNRPAFPIEHDRGVGSFMACDASGLNCLCQDEYHTKLDIVKVKNKEYVKENADKSS